MPHSDKNMMDDDEQRIQAIVGGPIEDVDRDEARERFYRHMETHLELPCEVTGHSDFDWEEWYVFGRGDRDEYEELKKTQPSHSDRYELLSVNLDASEWMLFPIRQDDVVCQNLALWYTGRCYGHREVHAALRSAARHVVSRCPGARVAYMDVSARRGGRLWPHKSHRRGVDVDVQFIGQLEDGTRRPVGPGVLRLGYLAKYGEDGRRGGLRFDAEANWFFIEGLRVNEHCVVEVVFVEPYVKSWLLEAGREAGALTEALQWAEDTLRYAGDEAADHKDHFHVRFAAG